MGNTISSSRHCRLRDQRYQLIGEICPHCGAKIFPPRDICPYCLRPTAVTVDPPQLQREQEEQVSLPSHRVGVSPVPT